MGRDYRKLRVFALADDLVPRIYRATSDFPSSERFSLQSQIRRSAISAACNIVEGSARRSKPEYVNFLNIAVGSASEVEYLLVVCQRLGLLSEKDGRQLCQAYGQLAAQLHTLINALTRLSSGP